MRRAILILVVTASLSPVEAVGAVTQPPDRRIRSLLVRSPFRQEEGSFEARRRRFVRPRAYPDSVIDRRREPGLAQLRRLPFHTQKLAVAPPGSPTAPAVVACQWTCIGPTNVSGRVTGIAIDPSDARRLFVTTVGGVWRSTDRARTWMRVSNVTQPGTSKPMNPGVFAAVAINPADGDEVIVAGGDPNRASHEYAGGRGLWRTTDGGDTWLPMSHTTLDTTLVYSIRIATSGTHEVYVATRTGLWKWNRSSWGLVDGMNAPCSDVVLDESGTSVVPFVGVMPNGVGRTKGVWRHDGSNWERRSSGISNHSHHIALAIASSQVLYARVVDMSSSNTEHLLGVYRTDDGGLDWTNKKTTELDDSVVGGEYFTTYNAAIAVHPSFPNTIYTGGLALWRSANGGDDWENVRDSPDYRFGKLHEDQHAIAFEPGNPDVVYIGNDGGIDRATFSSTSAGLAWQWDNVSHGLDVTEFYTIGTRQSVTPSLAGGTQDNGTPLTFGNWSWYSFGSCDGAWVAFDDKSTLTMYEVCNAGLLKYVNPVPGTTAPANAVQSLPSDQQLCPPVAADPSQRNRIIAGHCPESATEGLRVFRTNATGWESAMTKDEIPLGAELTFLAAVPATTFQEFYAGFAAMEGDDPAPGIWSTRDAGLSEWIRGVDVPSGYRPNAIAVDPLTPGRAYAALGGETGGLIIVTSDHGAHWKRVPTSGGFPTTAAATGVAVDPYRANVIYVSNDVGVIRGEITFSSTSTDVPTAASWARFDKGLPAGVSVNDVTVNAVQGTLTIATMGYGAWQMRIGTGAVCHDVEISVRDNVFDNGTAPAPYSVANPEHPIGPLSDGSFEPDASDAGRLYYWDSNDLRVTALSPPPHNDIDSPDHVEFETCPILVPDCPAGSIVDVRARKGTPSKFHVQVTNRGIRRSGPVRVIALATDVGTSLPLLPADIWATCPPGTPDPNWQTIGCTTIEEGIAPEMPAVVTFDWTPRSNALTHQCTIAFADCDDDPLVLGSERRASHVVPEHRQVGQRNLHLLDGLPSSTMYAMVYNPSSTSLPIEMVVSRLGVPSSVRLSIVIPTGDTLMTSGARTVRAPSRVAGGLDSLIRRLSGRRPGPSPIRPPVRRRPVGTPYRGRLFQAFAVDSGEAHVGGFLVPPRTSLPIAVIYDFTAMRPLTQPARFSIVSKQSGRVIGGSSWLWRGR